MGIYVNQVGFMPEEKKHATISGDAHYYLKNTEGKLIKEGFVKEFSFDESSNENIGLIDFSDIYKEGTYYFENSSGEKSFCFDINKRAYDKAFFDSMKMFYFQRCGIALEEKYAGKFKHAACHTGKVKELYNENNLFDCTGGWHDAGDYGRYVTAGAVAVAHLLYAYEMNADSFDVELNIPESGNGIPDILNECRFEIEWFFKMQKEDGSVYHKCTSMGHTAFVMPEEDPFGNDFIVTPVSSLATADFAAVMLLASRIYEKFDKDFSEKCKKQGLEAINWLEKNPDFLLNDPKECTTGGYLDKSDIDERFWALVELYRVTKDSSCIAKLMDLFRQQVFYTTLGWGHVAGLGVLSILISNETFDIDFINEAKNMWIKDADRLVDIAKANKFEITLLPRQFGWGGNMNVLCHSVVLFVANILTNKEEYRDAALYQLDYIFGRNALAFSYVSGEGQNSLKHPHNRPTQADGIEEMIPGFVSGGANGYLGDEAAKRLIPKGTAPMKCYVDNWESYSTNEITIYWNSPLVFALSFLCSLK